MMNLDDFLYKVASFLRILMICLFVLGLFIFCVMQCHAQPSPLVVAKHDRFTSYYDLERHNPAMVVYQLEARHFAGSYRVSGRHFKADTKLPRPRVLDRDYSGTGYVRGHLCSAGDSDSDKAWLKETYLTSNLVPMTLYCNSGPFKAIEDSCRALALQGHVLLLARGPLYYSLSGQVDNVIRAAASVTIPDGFFCYSKCKSCGQCFSWWCRNSGTKGLESVLRDLPGMMYYNRDERVSVLLQNIIGTWSREEYETITR